MSETGTGEVTGEGTGAGGGTDVDLDNEKLEKIKPEHCKELLEYFFQERPGLKTFYPNVTPELIENAEIMANKLLEKDDLKCTSKEAALYLSLLTLYDLIILVDDSISMVSEEEGARRKALVRTMLNIAKVYQLAREKGICSVRFINYLHRKVDITSKKVKNMLKEHPFQGLSRIGTQLKEKVLDDLLKDDAQMDKPLLVITITDGDVDGEKKTVLINVLTNFIEELKNKNKEHAIGFQFARVGKDVGALNLLSMLEDDKQIRDYVDCLPMGIEEMKNHRWVVLPKLLLGGISGYWNDQDASYRNVDSGDKKYQKLSKNGGIDDETVDEGPDDKEEDDDPNDTGSGEEPPST